MHMIDWKFSHHHTKYELGKFVDQNTVAHERNLSVITVVKSSKVFVHIPSSYFKKKL